MITVAQAFAQLVSRLEISDIEAAEALRQKEIVRERLGARLGGVTREFFAGAYGRRTAIRPLSDIDLFVVLDPQAHQEVQPPATPMKCLHKVQGALSLAYPDRRVTIRGRSVSIAFDAAGIGFEVVPAFDDGGRMLIPDHSRDSWIETDPEKHTRAFLAANERAGGKLRPILQAVKHWNVERQRPLRSFHLEVLAYKAFSGPPVNTPDGVRALLAHLARAVLEPCPEPAGVGPRLDASLTQQQRLAAQRRLHEAAGHAQRALDLELRGRTEEAHGIWRALLGAIYPERGVVIQAF